MNHLSGTVHEKYNGKGYYFSWKDPRTARQEEDWLGARNWCRMRCMDSVSLQSSDENEYIKRKIVQGLCHLCFTNLYILQTYFVRRVID